MKAMNMFLILAIVMLFWSLGINIFTYTLPSEARDVTTSVSDLNHDINMDDVAGQIESSLTDQTKIPLIDIGALVFYSGNLLVDLFLNFLFAIPEMIGVLLGGAMRLFSLDTTIVAYVQVFVAAAVGISYVMAIIAFLTNVRSGRIEG